MANRVGMAALVAAISLLAACAQDPGQDPGKDSAPPKPAVPAGTAASAQSAGDASATGGTPSESCSTEPATAGGAKSPGAAPACTRRAKPYEVFPPDPNAGAPIASPFGDPWDPLKPPPVVPEPKGAGITAATLVASGDADVEELPRPAGSAAVFYGVIVDVTIEAGSTTQALSPESITLAPASGEPAGLFAACLPTLEDADALSGGAGTRIAAWTVSIGERTWRCGGGNARMVRQVGPGGFKVTAPAPAGWSGPMVLLFEGQAETPKSVTLTGKTVEIGAAKDAAKN